MKKQRYTYLKIGFISLLLHWVFLWIGTCLVKGVCLTDFFHMIYEHASNAGDIPHYVEIATNWYHATGEHANNIAFYPLFPALMKILYVIVRDYIVAGMIISNVCTFIAGIYLYRLMKEDYDDTRAWMAVFLLTVFPVGMFMIEAYTESLFIMLTIMGLFYIRKRKWIVVGVVGMLAALSRSQGIVLLVPAVYELCVVFREKKERTWKGLALGFIPVGTLIYLLINQIVFGHWGAFLEYQAAEPWYNKAHWIADNLAAHYSMALQYPYLGTIIYWAQIILYFAVMGILFYGLRNKVRTSYIAWGGAYLFLTYLHGWMISGPRYVMSCVPIYIILAACKKKEVGYGCLVASSILAVIFSMWYIQGQAIL